MVNLNQALQSVDFYKKVKIRDMLCVEYICPAQTEFSNFWTDCACLVYCTSGKKVYSTHGEDFEVKPGAVFFMKKGGYSAKNYLEERYCALMFFMPDSFFQGFLFRFPHLKLTSDREENLWPDGIMPLQMEPTLEAYFFSILNYFSNVAKVSRELLEVKLDELLLSIFTQPMHRDLAGYLSSLEQEKVIKLRQIMEENFASGMKLEEYAQLCGMSLSSFKRQFVKVYGEAPGKWLLTRKLELTKRLLLHSEKNVNEIASQVGFENPSHFIRVFKKYFELTPLKFRARHKAMS